MGKVKVIDRGWNEIHKNILTLKNAGVKVGYPSGGNVVEGNNFGSGREPFSEMADVATIAFFLEFGTQRGIPEYGFVRKAFDKNLDSLIPFRNRLYKMVSDGRISANQALGLLGERLVRDVRKMIRDIKIPANQQKTIDRKGSSNPGIDTGQMIQSVQYKIIKDVSGLKLGVQVT